MWRAIPKCFAPFPPPWLGFDFVNAATFVEKDEEKQGSDCWSSVLSSNCVWSSRRSRLDSFFKRSRSLAKRRSLQRPETRSRVVVMRCYIIDIPGLNCKHWSVGFRIISPSLPFLYRHGSAVSQQKVTA